MFPSRRKGIFVHGCFWHMHECQYGSVVPATRTGFWQTKRGGNVERDRTHAEALVRQGWKVLVVWECETQPHGSGRFSTSSARSRQQSQTFSSVAINHDFVVESPDHIGS